MLIVCGAGLQAQQSPARRWVDSARASLPLAVSRGDTVALKSIDVTLRRALVANPDDAWLQHYLATTLYRRGTVRFGQPSPGSRAMFVEADSLLVRSLRTLDLPESHALRSATLGMQIADQASAMVLGPMADEEMRLAMTAAPRNPRVLIIQGISLLYTPPDYGGGVDKAEATLRAAVAAVAADTPPAPYPNWGHAEAYAWLGVVYTQQGKRDLAREALTKSLSIDPENSWVKHVLMPALNKPPE